MVCQRDFKLIFSLIGLAPSLFTFVLLTSHAFVFVDDRLVVGGLPGSVLIFEHTTHAQDSFRLLRPVLLLLLLRCGNCTMLTDLLVSPVTLVLSVKPHPIMVH